MVRLNDVTPASLAPSRLPFQGSCVMDISHTILTTALELPAAASISPELSDLLTRMLEKDPARRISMQVHVDVLMLEISILLRRWRAELHTHVCGVRGGEHGVPLDTHTSLFTPMHTTAARVP